MRSAQLFGLSEKPLERAKEPTRRELKVDQMTEERSRLGQSGKLLLVCAAAS